MDVLSDVITLMRAGRPRSALVAWQAPWAQQFAAVPGSAGFQIVLRGSCWLTTPDAEPVRLEPGDIVFRPHGHGHTLADSPSTPVRAPPCGPDRAQIAPGFVNVSQVAPGIEAGAGTAALPRQANRTTVTLCRAYEVDSAVVHPLLHDLPELIHLTVHPGLRATVDLLAAELERPRLGADAIIPALLDTLLVDILRTWLEQNPARGGWPAALNDPATSAALQAMHREPARPWTVATLAAQAGLSRAPFARRFAVLLGRPPLTYLTWWRLTTAARLLRESDAPLSAIARQVGYTSEFAFANAFKRQYRTAPGRYRRNGVLVDGGIDS
jgi:AraC-like DNA-binding protein